MSKNKVTVVFEPEVVQMLLERQEQKDYETVQMVIYDILGEWYAAKVAIEQKAEPSLKKQLMLTLRAGLHEQLAQEQARKGYGTIQMVIYDIIGEWYAQQKGKI